MFISKKLNEQFNAVISHVNNTYNSVDASGAAIVIIHNNKVVTEKYWGNHSKELDARHVQEDTQFHIASVRKSYIGFAVAFAIHNGYIASIDDEVTKYLPALDSTLLNGTTLRQLLTHTHGLRENDGEVCREFTPGQSWAYRGINISLLTNIIKKTTGKTVSQILSEYVFQPMGFKETGWYGQPNDKLAEVIRDMDDPIWKTHLSTDGDQMNMYVSARELAQWGYLHLKQGFVNGEQVVHNEIIELATSIRSPKTIDADFPQNGFLWFVKDLPAKKTEIGELVPKGSYQILGYTGVALLVIPEHEIVAVRMFNSFGSPDGFDYLSDIRSFGDTVMESLLKDKI
ncbi:serine hydrolase [Psychrobacillus sp. OK032]|uniref:serine hydrolase domain-containing protein n=1 Tax=Psychrobacillus sp. OK032 TaxID=1884358 RepID=UPI0008CB15CC|nr:serine hydrolase domain-containing protein [Psychrobacillus sp. OK032]SES18491.1 CubicO group peptidase, beta-lactamase class C family [Psychrobacillus sp. OK032]